MTPLEAARRLAEREPWDVGEPAPACVACSGFKMDGHRPDCPWLALPRIVAALEAAERVVAAWKADTGHHPIPGSMGGFSVNFDRAAAYARERREAEEALVDALTEEGPT